MIRSSVVVVHYLNIVRRTIHPPKADSPLTVDPDAVLPLAISRQSLQPIATNTDCYELRATTVAKQRRRASAAFGLLVPQTTEISVRDDR
jgi:hypothetical protein